MCETVAIATGTVTSALCDHSSASEPTLHGNSINTDTQDKTGMLVYISLFNND